MKKKFMLITFILCVFLVGSAFAWTVKWDAVDSAEGYMFYHKALADADYQQIDVGAATEQSLDSIGLVQGSRYEFYVEAYTEEPRSYSGESDHIRWTYPTDPQVIELPPEQKVIINIY